MFRLSTDAPDKIIFADDAIIMVEHFFDQRGFEAGQDNLYVIFDQSTVTMTQLPGFCMGIEWLGRRVHGGRGFICTSVAVIESRVGLDCSPLGFE